MVLEIITPTQDDAAELADILWDSHLDSPILRRLINDAPAGGDHQAALRAWTTIKFKQMWGHGPRRVVRDTENGAIVASLAYGFVPTSHAEALSKAPKTDWHQDAPSGINTQIMRELELTDWKARVETMGTSQFISLESLATRPSYQRRGAGRMLVDHVLAEADKRNLPIFVVSSPAGRSLYTKSGFEPVQELKIDMSPIGEEPYTHLAMRKNAPRPEEPADFPELPRRPVKVARMEKTEADLQQLVDLGKRAFGPDPLIDFCFPGPPAADPAEEKTTDKGEEKQPTDVDRHMERINNPQFRYWKAIDADKDDGPILGTAMWFMVENPREEDDHVPWGQNYPPGARIDCLEATMGQLRRWRNDYFRKENNPYLYMSVLTVDPEAQRRGIGAALLREGLKEADARGLETFIEASPSGLGLYKKFGWEEVTRNSVNLKDFGGDDVNTTTVALIRKPGAKEKTKPTPPPAVDLPVA